MSNTFKKKFISSFLWSFTGRSGYIVIGVLTNIILARILGPQVFGKVGIIMFFIAIAKVLTESGLSGALIRKPTISESDYSTVFLFNLGISTLLFIVFYILSGFLSDFYEDDSLRPLLIFASLILITNAFQIVNNAKLIRALDYRKISIIEFISVTIGSLIGIILAIFFDVGAYAVITVNLLTSVSITLLLWFHVGRLKTISFNKQSFKYLYSFGINTTLASLLNTAFDNVYQLILGKYFTIKQTGFYYQAKRLQNVPIVLFNSTIISVAFASLSKIQNNKNKFFDIYNRINSLFMIMISLVVVLTFLYADHIIMILYGEEWLGSVFYFKVLMITSFFFLQELFNRIIFKIFNQTRKILYLEIAKKILQSLTIIAGIIYKDIQLLMYGLLLTGVISYIMNFYYSRSIINMFSWAEVINVLKTIISGTLTIFLGIIGMTQLNIEGYNSFWLAPAIIIFFLLCIKLMRVSSIIDDINLIKRLIKEK